MPQAGDTYDWVGVDDSGNPVTQKMMWNADMLSTNQDTGEVTQGGWVPYIAPYSQTTNQDTGQVSYYIPGQGYTAPAQMSAAQLTPDVVYGQYGQYAPALQGALNAFAQSSGADPNTVLQAANDYVNTYGLSSTENPYDLAQKIIRGTDWGGAANQYKEPFISNMFADPGVQAVGQQVQQAWQAQNQPDTWVGGLKNTAKDIGSFASFLASTPIGTAALSAGLGALGGAAEPVDPEMLQAYKDAGLLAQDATDFSALSQPMAYTPDGGVIRASDLATEMGVPTNPWDAWPTPEGSFPSDLATEMGVPTTGSFTPPTVSSNAVPQGFWDRLTSIQSLSDVGSLIKDYPQYAGAALGFLKSGNLMGAAAGYGLGSGIGNLAAGNYLSGGLQTGLGLLGLGATGNQGLLGGPLGKVFGGTPAPGAGGAGASGAGAGGAGLPGMIRPYQFAQTRNPNWGKPGEPYFIQQYTAQPTYRAANGGQIPDLDNMYPQSSIDHSSYATPLQRPMQQAVVSSGYGPRLNPFTGEEQMAGGGLADLTPTYAAGGRLLRGPGDGVSDSIPAVIGGKQPQRAALADGEFVLPARIVSEIGNGSTEAGARKLYAMMDRIQKRRGSTLKNVAADTRAEKLLPA